MNTQAHLQSIREGLSYATLEALPKSEVFERLSQFSELAKNQIGPVFSGMINWSLEEEQDEEVIARGIQLLLEEQLEDIAALLLRHALEKFSPAQLHYSRALVLSAFHRHHETKAVLREEPLLPPLASLYISHSVLSGSIDFEFEHQLLDKIEKQEHHEVIRARSILKRAQALAKQNFELNQPNPELFQAIINGSLYCEAHEILALSQRFQKPFWEALPQVHAIRRQRLFARFKPKMMLILSHPVASREGPLAGDFILSSANQRESLIDSLQSLAEFDQPNIFQTRGARPSLLSVCWE